MRITVIRNAIKLVLRVNTDSDLCCLSRDIHAMRESWFSYRFGHVALRVCAVQQAFAAQRSLAGKNTIRGASSVKHSLVCSNSRTTEIASPLDLFVK